MKVFSFLALFLVSSLALAGEHTLTNFRGGDVELKAYDHAVAGSVKDFLVFANKDEETGVSTFTAKKDGKIITTEIKRQENGTFGTSFAHVTKEGEERNVTVAFKTLTREENKYVFTVNGQDVSIYVQADDFRNNHFINPQYNFEFSDKKLSVKLENGQACYNFSAHLIAILLTAYSL